MLKKLSDVGQAFDKMLRNASGDLLGTDAELP